MAATSEKVVQQEFFDTIVAREAAEAEAEFSARLHAGGLPANERAVVAFAREGGFTRLLDHACGDGVYGRLALRHAPDARVVGLDISPVSVARAREKAAAEGLAARTDYVVGDIDHPPFKPGAFDAAMMINVIHHFPHGRALGELHRAMRPGARLLSIETVMNNPFRRGAYLFWRFLPRKVRHGMPEAVDGERPPVTPITAGKVRRLLLREGYRPEAEERHYLFMVPLPFLFAVMPATRRVLTPKVLRRLHRVEERLMKVPPFRQMCAVVVLRSRRVERG